MSMARAPLRKIVIVGDGQTGLMAGIALGQAVPSAQIAIVTTGPGFRGFADLASTALPFTNRLHDRLGLGEDTMVREAGATHRLAVIYAGWAGAGTSASMSYGMQSAGRLWAGLAALGEGNAPAAPAVMDLGEALAKAGRFAPPAPEQDGLLAELDYALRWDRQRYTQLLVNRVSALNVRHHTSAIADIRQDEGGIQQIDLADGTTLEADLWLDCGGHAAPLASLLPGFARINWASRLPVRRVAFVRGNRGQLALADQLALTPAGWAAQTLGPDGKEAMLGLAEGRGDDDARRLFGNDDLHFFDLAPGRIESAWQNNVVALGDAAMQIEPLAWTNLDVAHRMIDLLLEWLPGTDTQPLERKEFNRRFALMAEANCDFVASHYAAPAAEALFGLPEQSAVLETSLRQFRLRGRTPFAEEAPLAADQWQAVLRALGIRPGNTALSRTIEPASLQSEISAHHRMVVAEAGRLPSYDAWLRSMTLGHGSGG